MSAANFRMRLFAPAQNGAEWRNFLEVFFRIFPKMIIFSRFSPRRFTSQGTTAPQVRGQAIAMSEKSSNFAADLSKESKAALRPQDEEALRNR